MISLRENHFNSIAYRKKKNFEFKRKLVSQRIEEGNLKLLNQVINCKPSNKL